MNLPLSNQESRDSLLSIFVKAPRPGTVKTRLAQALGPEAACAAYCELVETLVERLVNLSQVELRFTPEGALPEIRRWLRGAWAAQPQGAGDLGQRLSATFAQAFAAGRRRVLIIGSDCPHLNEMDVNQAWARLDDADVVLGPATDGGYWLIGLRRPQPDLFQDISWSTRHVFEQTTAKCREHGLRVAQLRELTDIDSMPEWENFVKVKKL